MALKPIYEKSPLTVLKAAALRPGQVKMNNAVMEQLYAMLENARNEYAAWEGMIRLGAVLGKKDVTAEKWTRQMLDMQKEDGSLPLTLPQALAVMRAAMALYEQTAERSLLEKIAAWCGCLAADWENVIACQEIRTTPADLMEMLVNLYRITGKKAVSNLCAKLRQEGMDWSGTLHTFSVQRPMSRVTPWADMEAGLAAEQGSEAGFYTRQYLTCHAENLADGMRSAQVNGLYSGNGMELSAGKTGWEKISRYHGALCGGITADETIAGTSPSAAVDAASLGAWAEAFAQQDAAWAFDALETLVENGLPAAVVEGKLVPFQRVNSLKVNAGTNDCYHVHDADAPQVWRALARLSRGFAAAASTAVMSCKDGMEINLYMPGTYLVPVEGGACRVEIAGGDGKYTITMKAKQAFKAAIRIRVPAWTDDAYIEVNQDGGDEGRPGQYLTLERTWNPGDVIRAEFGLNLRTVAAHHQGAAVLLGAKVMAAKAEGDNWAVALCGEPEIKDGKVTAALAPVADWRKKGAVPADLPVLPACGEAVETELTPYAQTPCRIAMFPRGKQA